MPETKEKPFFIRADGIWNKEDWELLCRNKSFFLNHRYTKGERVDWTHGSFIADKVDAERLNKTLDAIKHDYEWNDGYVRSRIIDNHYKERFLIGATYK